MINNVVLTGRTTKEIELVKSRDGQTSIAAFQLAVNRSGKDAGADFITCKAFNKTAEILSTRVSKGSLIGIEGRIQTGSYEKEGQRVYTTDIMVTKITFLESKKDGVDTYRPQSNQSDFGTSDAELDLDDDDLPF